MDVVLMICFAVLVAIFGSFSYALVDDIILGEVKPLSTVAYGIGMMSAVVSIIDLFFVSNVKMRLCLAGIAVTMFVASLILLFDKKDAE